LIGRRLPLPSSSKRHRFFFAFGVFEVYIAHGTLKRRVFRPGSSKERTVNATLTRDAHRRHDESLLQQLERYVHLRTGRRVRNLTVENHSERVVLRGLADSYYVKQMAQQGVLDLLPGVCLDNAIAVDSST
jgi:hypothetical protein